MTKALEVCRALKAQGCRVVLLETSKYWMVASRFSRNIDRFAIVPIPEQDPKAYLAAVKRIVEEESAVAFVPVCSPVASQYDALVANVLPSTCLSWSLEASAVRKLDDKVTFAQMAKEAGLPMPETLRMRSRDAVLEFNRKLTAEGTQARFVLKSLAYDSMHRLDMFTLPRPEEDVLAYTAGLNITESNPWLVQEMLSGVEHSSCALVRDGRVLAFCDNEASISCFNYTYAGVPAIRAWVSEFCRHYALSGVVCIDFFVTDDGVVKAIECNPRFSSNIMEFHRNRGELGRVLLSPDTVPASEGPVLPRPNAAEVNWLLTDLYYEVAKPAAIHAASCRWWRLPKYTATLFSILLFKKDAYFDPHDPLPFLALYLLHLPVLLARTLYNGNRWAKIDLCIGKMTEEFGD